MRITKTERKLSKDEQKTILRARAESLARETTKEESTEGFLEIVEFVLAYEKYGIESQYIREVYPLKDFTPLPCTPPFVLGITNVRGQVFSIIDIKKFFDLPDKGLTDLNRILITKSLGMNLGILADLIVGVRRVPIHEIQSDLPTLTDKRSEYLKGVTNDMVVILDAEKILSDPRIIIKEEVE